MTKNDYDNISSCIRRRGTRSQKKALKKMMITSGWDKTHDNKLEIDILNRKARFYQNKVRFLKRILFNNNLLEEFEKDEKDWLDNCC